jgi:hypothetical protein
VHIPLDYYRILGLPIQATADQLRQAHRDRTLQLPRREYSDAAIASRRHLLDEAYAILSHPDRRHAYDATFLARAYELTPAPVGVLNGELSPATSGNDRNGHDLQTPSIEVPDAQLVGALLVLQELGEYELVLKLGRPFLTGGKANLRGGIYGDPNIVYPDIVLTVALACLELGREQWQQGQYENAAEALETGQQLLLREGLFAGVRGEIQADLYKLRPYRVLELLALPEHQAADRLKGMQLLQDMLRERGGIDGTESDQSGLTIDDFLRFIQQLRSYLTATEQQVLFEEEARRPSAVATYLAVYALIAKGFAERQPAFIQRAKHLLSCLSPRQDVHLEQAVCTLLLGQTEEASQALELSQEQDSLTFIREHSQGSPDLLPGLCLYAERWLQDEVFPHFRDLSRRRVALKDYFADRQVQEYLESLPNDPEVAEDWSIAPKPSSNQSAYRATPVPQTIGAQRPPEPETMSSALGSSVSSNMVEGDRGVRGTADSLIEVARSRIAARIGGLTDHGNLATMPVAERIPVLGVDGNGELPPAPTRQRRGGRGRRKGDGAAMSPDSSIRPLNEGVRTATNGRVVKRAVRSDRRKWPLLPIVVASSVALLGFLGGLWLLRSLQASSKQSAQLEQPLLQLDRPLISMPQTSQTADLAGATLTNPVAQQVLESWFVAKAAAMGTEHDASQLEQILVDPKLSEWRGASADAKAAGTYRKFKHEVKVTAVEQAKDKPDQAKVKADVVETTEYYEAGAVKDANTDQFPVQYSLVRRDGKWRIENWEILN